MVFTLYLNHNKNKLLYWMSRLLYLTQNVFDTIIEIYCRRHNRNCVMFLDEFSASVLLKKPRQWNVDKQFATQRVISQQSEIKQFVSLICQHLAKMVTMSVLPDKNTDKLVLSHIFRNTFLIDTSLLHVFFIVCVSAAKYVDQTKNYLKQMTL